MTDPIETPPAQPGSGTPPAAPPEPPKDKTFTQAELNALLKEEKKQWQGKLKDLEEKAAKWDDLQERSKTEIERITGERDKHKGEAKSTKLENIKLRALMKAGADPEKIDALMKRVVGSTPEEIESDLAELKTLGLIAAKQAPPPQTPGSNPANPGSVSSGLDDQIADLEAKAMKTGNPDDWMKVNRLKAQKYKHY